MTTARIITVRDKIRDVRVRWYDQYKHTFANHVAGRTEALIYANLCTLDLDRCSVADVAAVIGNDAWTDLTCDGCEARRQPFVVEVGQPMDYDSKTARLCKVCVFDAARRAAEIAEIDWNDARDVVVTEVLALRNSGYDGPFMGAAVEPLFAALAAYEKRKG